MVHSIKYNNNQKSKFFSSSERYFVDKKTFEIADYFCPLNTVTKLHYFD